MHEPNRIYIRHPAIMNDVETEDTWYYYDKKVEGSKLKLICLGRHWSINQVIEPQGYSWKESFG